MCIMYIICYVNKQFRWYFLKAGRRGKKLADNAIVQVRKRPKDTQMVTPEQLAVNRLSSRHNATCTNIILQDIQWLG